MKIRLARKEDLPAMIRTENACFGEERFDRGVVRSFLERQDAFALVAILEDAIVGTAMCQCSGRGHVGRIASVAVNPDQRGEGLGSMLVKACEKEFRRRGVTRFVLEVAVDNLQAIRTYQSNGYIVVRTIENYYSNGRGAYCMEKDVTMIGKRTKVRVS